MWQAGNRLCSAVHIPDLSNQIIQCLEVTKDFMKKGKTWLTAIPMPPCLTNTCHKDVFHSDSLLPNNLASSMVAAIHPLAVGVVGQ